MMRVARCLLVGVVGSVVGCGDNRPFTPDAPSGPECADGVDNDGDGMIDFPDDLGCTSEAEDDEGGDALPACSDSRDNDGDGKMDFPDDPGCFLPQGDTEADDCPTGPGCPQCGNGTDDNSNGMTDFPEDPGCTSAADNTEFLEDPVACGPGLTIKGLPATGMDTGTFDGTSTSMLATSCGGGNGASAVAYLIHLYEPKVLVATTDLPGNTVDTVLDLRSASDCDSPGAHIACNDNVGTEQGSSITESLPAGSYYLIVEGKSASVMGTYAVRVQLFAGEGGACGTDAECGPGLVCRIPLGGSQMICTGPVCDDGLDDDSDGKTDYPDDPGCTAPDDDTEDDDCPDGPNCPACADGDDNDGDGMTDYPADPSCPAASGDNEACTGELDPILPITGPTTTGTLVGTTDEHDPACVSTDAADRLYTLQVPALETLVIDTIPSAVDTVLSLMDSTCSEPSLHCDDQSGGNNDSLITATNLPAGAYVIAVDAFSAFSLNTFTLNVAGTVVPGESCEGSLFQAGALTCSAGFACKGPMGSRTCAPSECTDGSDNNLDGKTDYPEDPGCASPSDDGEDTVCPGATCPVCADGIDNEGDGLTDYPEDSGCVAASGDNESCAGELDPILDITGPTTTGTFVGGSDDHVPSCGGTTGGPDKIFELEIPTLQSLVIDTEGSVAETVLSLMSASCAEPSLACDDDGGVGSGDSLITRSFMAAGSYTIAVDADSTTLGTFNLHVSGTVVPFGSCEHPLFQAGALTCSLGFACNGPAGSRTCSPAACLDGMDNNLDGNVDYPNDPGCDSPSDNVEDTVCPGPMCPICSDGVDNDGDFQTDYPDDTSCSAASGTEYCSQTEPIGTITQEVTTGTTAGQSNDFAPSCGSSFHSAPDLAYQLHLPPMATLNLNLSGFDGAHSLLEPTCNSALACSDPPDMPLTNIAAGSYFVIVDGWGSGSGPFTLTTTGTVASGGSCEGPLFQAGAFTCATGLTCLGPLGMRTCQ